MKGEVYKTVELFLYTADIQDGRESFMKTAGNRERITKLLKKMQEKYKQINKLRGGAYE